MQYDTDASSNATRRFSIIAVIVGLLIVGYWLRVVLLPFVLAAALAFVTSPLVRLMSMRLRLPRWISAVIVYTILLALLAVVGYWFTSILIPQAMMLAHGTPDLVRTLFKQFTGSDRIHIFGMTIDAQSIIDSAQASFRNWINGPAQLLASGLAALMMGFLTLLLMLFFFLSGPQLANGALLLLPPDTRDSALNLARKLHPVLMHYIFGVLVVICVTGILSWIVFGIIVGLPHAALISVVIGVLEAIPVVGPAAAALLVGLVAVTTGKVGIVVGVMIGALGLRLFIDQLLGPVVLGKAVRLHPVVIIFALLVGGTLYGVLGILLAVPVAASIKIALQTFYREPAAL